MSLAPVPPGHLAAVVTYLEMTAAPPARPMPPSPLSLLSWPAPSPDRYRALFRRVGAPWLWFSRLAMDDAELGAILSDPGVAVFAVVDARRVEVGLLELDFRRAGDCALAFLGLVPELTGRGEGRWLMAQALLRAWRPGVSRVTVHTCSLDHPGALGFYRRQGFAPVSRAVETFADPRLAGLLPCDAAPQIPLLQPSAGAS